MTQPKFINGAPAPATIDAKPVPCRWWPVRVRRWP
jgi:hypothetical protein